MIEDRARLLGQNAQVKHGPGLAALGSPLIPVAGVRQVARLLRQYAEARHGSRMTKVGRLLPIPLSPVEVALFVCLTAHLEQDRRIGGDPLVRQVAGTQLLPLERSRSSPLGAPRLGKGPE